MMPLHHTNGVNNQLIAPFLVGATVVLAERFRAEDIEDQIAAHGVTYLTGVPTMYSRILPHLRDQARLRSLTGRRPSRCACTRRSKPPSACRWSCPTGCPRPRAPQP
ncbi:MAG: AMP-binding protein [Acidobacteria bacterium]|nr:AMP-binding protein [Acidobacteriota bacterium]